MKKLAGLVIILAVLVLGGYYGMGVLTERTIKKNIEIINQTNGLFADVTEYKRSWFTSHAEIKWRLHVPERVIKDSSGNSQTVAAQDYQIDMPVAIFHGPVIYDHKKIRFGMGYAETQFPFPNQYQQQFDAQFTKDSIKPELDLSIFVNYLCKSTVELSLPAFKLIAKDGGIFEWKGMKSDTTVSSHRDRVDGKLLMDGLQFVKADFSVTMGKTISEYDLHQTTAGLFLGDASFTLPSLDVLDKQQKLFNLQMFTLSSNSDIEDNLFSTHFSMSLQSLFANNKSYGPGDFEVTLRNLDADVLARINEQATAIQNGTDAQRQQAVIGMLPELPKLFSKGAELEISKCSLKVPEGVIDGSLLITLPAGDSSNPFELMQKVQGNAKLKMPAALVKQLMQQSIMQQMSKQPDMQQVLAQQLQQNNASGTQPALTTEQLATMQAEKQVATLEQNGVLKANGSDYVIELNLEQGKFNVNGLPFNPAMLKF